MAHFDASGCPSEFLKIVQKLEADIQGKARLISKENQLIEEAEKQILEKSKSKKQQELKNAELEQSIQHLNTVYQTQASIIESLREAGDMLNEQVKNKQEVLEILKEKNQRQRQSCEFAYQNHLEKFRKRMEFYETWPLVPEYKAQLQKITEIHKRLELKQKEESEIKAEIERLQDDSMLPYKSITEWGVALAKAYKQRIIYTSKLQKVSMLKEEVNCLEKRKNKLQKQAELKQADCNRPLLMKENRSTSAVNLTGLSFPSPTLTSFKPSSVPDFKSFFKDKGFSSSLPATGSSGSSLQANFHSSSLPNISSLFNNVTSKAKTQSENGDTGKTAMPSTNEGEPNFSHSTREVPKAYPAVPLQRSLSLTTLLPQVKPLQKTDSTRKSTFKTGRSLSDWLTSAPSQSNQSTPSHQTPAPQRSKLALQKPMKNKSERSSWPFPSAQMHSRATEISLLRQVQEKMLHQKITKEQEHDMANDSAQELSTDMEVEETENNKDADEPTNMLAMFDGPVYDVPIKSVGPDMKPMDVEDQQSGSDRTSLIKNNCRSPSFSLEEHERIMANIKKSPENGFCFQSNIMPTEGAENSFLISPSLQSKSPVRSPESLGHSNDNKNDFQFAVPTALPPNHSKRIWDSNDSFSFNFDENEPTSPEESSPFKGFSFGGAGDASQSVSTGFDFSTKRSQDTSDQAFSFNFDGNKESSPPESPNLFSFRGDAQTSTENFFSSPDNNDDDDETPSFSFASIFGCNK